MEVTMRAGGILGAIAVVWLLIGVFAAYQRHYFESGPINCAQATTVALTVAAGPLNYKFNPAKGCPDVNVDVPQPK
jgi:membrane-bound ClpP family serine protease